LSEQTVERIFEEQSNGLDLALGVPLRFGMGYGLASETMPMGPRSFSWGGYGGSLVFNDLDAHLTVTYVMNRMEPGVLGDRRGASMVLSTIAALAGG
jgi:CubicO group peptidase (beta-lactamase class C family)